MGWVPLPPFRWWRRGRSSASWSWLPAPPASSPCTRWRCWTRSAHTWRLPFETLSSTTASARLRWSRSDTGFPGKCTTPSARRWATWACRPNASGACWTTAATRRPARSSPAWPAPSRRRIWTSGRPSITCASPPTHPAVWLGPCSRWSGTFRPAPASRPWPALSHLPGFAPPRCSCTCCAWRRKRWRTSASIRAPPGWRLSFRPPAATWN